MPEITEQPLLSWGLNRSSPAHDMACAGPSVCPQTYTDQEHAQALARHASGQNACLQGKWVLETGCY